MTSNVSSGVRLRAIISATWARRMPRTRSRRSSRSMTASWPCARAQRGARGAAQRWAQAKLPRRSVPAAPGRHTRRKGRARRHGAPACRGPRFCSPAFRSRRDANQKQGGSGRHNGERTVAAMKSAHGTSPFGVCAARAHSCRTKSSERFCCCGIAGPTPTAKRVSAASGEQARRMEMSFTHKSTSRLLAVE